VLMAACYQDMLRDLGAQAEIEICAFAGLEDLVAKVHDARSLVVVGGPVGRWLTSPEERFANRLTLAGCQVIFAAAGTNATQRRVAACPPRTPNPTAPLMTSYSPPGSGGGMTIYSTRSIIFTAALAFGLAATGHAQSPTPAEPEKKPEPFAFADFTWL